MKIISQEELKSENFNPIFINGLRQYWKNTKSFQCFGSPKKYNLLLHVTGCRITYTDKSGNTYVANDGDTVYTPMGSEYRARLSDFTSEESHTVGVNFLLNDENGAPLLLSDEILIFHTDASPEISILFDKTAANSQDSPLILNRITLLEIIYSLIGSPKSHQNTIISRTVSYLIDNIEENPSISDLARRFGVSTVYLRRKFKDVMGTSPAKYRNDLRLKAAVSYLKFGDITVQEISDTLGYATVSHFIKEFKTRYGISPLKYRKTQCI